MSSDMSSRKPTVKPIDLDAVKRHSIRTRDNKTELKVLGRPMRKITGSDYFESLPGLLKAADLSEFIDLAVRAVLVLYRFGHGGWKRVEV